MVMDPTPGVRRRDEGDTLSVQPSKSQRVIRRERDRSDAVAAADVGDRPGAWRGIGSRRIGGSSKRLARDRLSADVGIVRAPGAGSALDGCGDRPERPARDRLVAREGWRKLLAARCSGSLGSADQR